MTVNTAIQLRIKCPTSSYLALEVQGIRIMLPLGFFYTGQFQMILRDLLYQVEL